MFTVYCLIDPCGLISNKDDDRPTLSIVENCAWAHEIEAAGRVEGQRAENRGRKPILWQRSVRLSIIHCVSKNIPNIFDCNSKTNYQILIIFGTNISDTISHQMTVQFPTSQDVCFYLR